MTTIERKFWRFISNRMKKSHFYPGLQLLNCNFTDSPLIIKPGFENISFESTKHKFDNTAVTIENWKNKEVE